MSTDVKVLLTRAITRLMVGDRERFKKLATKAVDKHDRDIHLYVTIREILEAKVG